MCRQGSGPPLVLVHGYLGGADMWRDQLQTLSAAFDVIAVELPGYGRSADQTALTSITRQAQAVLDHLTAIGIEQFDLMGHSMGGMIVQEMTALAPDRITRLICYGTGPNGILPNRFETIEQSRARLERDGVEVTARRIAATWFIKGAAAPQFEACAALARDVTLETAQAGLTAMEGWDGRGALAGITQPTLIVWGDRDRSYGWSEPHALWTGIPGSSLAVMPGCSHNAHLEQPALFNLIVENFLTEGPQELSA